MKLKATKRSPTKVRNMNAPHNRKRNSQPEKVITRHRKSGDEIPGNYKNTDCSDRVLKLILGLSRLIDRRLKFVEY